LAYALHYLLSKLAGFSHRRTKMSKIHALITTLVLGSSSVALADTSVSFNASARASWGLPTTTVRDHRTTTSVQPAPAIVRGTWISLAQPLSGNAELRLHARAPLDQIRIQSESGSSYISSVIIRFEDGSRQHVRLDRWIDARNPILQFNLERSGRVDQIRIKSSGRFQMGSYQVFGLRAQRFERPVPPVYQPPVYQPPVHQPNLVTLASGLNFFGTTGYKFVNVAAGTGRFSTIRIQGLTGQVHLQHIVVNFTNGYTQTLDAIERNLVAGQYFDLPLDAAGGNSVSQIIVFTNRTSTPVQTLTGEISVSGF